MRGNTNPCNVCDYCDDSCDVCLHQPYEHTIAGRYREAYSDDEWAGDYAVDGGYASTDVDTASDEEGSWFTTPWSQLITQRVAGYEVDPDIGVQLDPLPEAEAEGKEDEDEEEKREQQAKEGRHRRRAEKEQRAAAAEGEEDPARGRRQRRLRRRRRRRDSPAAAAVVPDPAAVVKDAAAAAAAAAPVAAEGAEPAANGEVPAGDPEGTARAANDEAWDLFSDGPAEPANAQAPNEGDALPKDTHNNMWRATVHSSHVSLVSVS